MEVSLTEESLAWLDSNNISLHNRFGKRLHEGSKVYFDENLEVEPFIGYHAGNVFCKMGFMSYTNSPLPMNISLGRYCSIAWGLTFPSWNHPIDPISTSIFTHDPSTDLVVRVLRHSNVENRVNFVPCPQKSPVKIENDVWIGQDATLVSGITIGTGSVIAANSVVTKSVNPYEIVGGNPARTIRYRFSKKIIEDLLELEWWNYSFADFSHLNIARPEIFVDQFSAIKSSINPYAPTLIKLSDIPR